MFFSCFVQAGYLWCAWLSEITIIHKGCVCPWPHMYVPWYVSSDRNVGISFLILLLYIVSVVLCTDKVYHECFTAEVLQLSLMDSCNRHFSYKAFTVHLSITMYGRPHLLQQKDEEWHKVQVFKMKTWLSFYNNNIDLKLSTLRYTWRCTVNLMVITGVICRALSIQLKQYGTRLLDNRKTKYVCLCIFM